MHPATSAADTYQKQKRWRYPCACSAINPLRPRTTPLTLPASPLTQPTVRAAPIGRNSIGHHRFTAHFLPRLDPRGLVPVPVSDSAVTRPGAGRNRQATSTQVRPASPETAGSEVGGELSPVRAVLARAWTRCAARHRQPNQTQMRHGTTAPHAEKRGRENDGARAARGLTVFSAHTHTHGGNARGPDNKGGSFPLIATVCFGVLPLNISSTSVRRGGCWYG